MRGLARDKKRAMRRGLIVVAAFLTSFAACATQEISRSSSSGNGDGGSGASGSGGGVSSAGGAAPDGGMEDDSGFNFDAQGGDAGDLDENDVCAAVAQKAETKQLPV